MVAKECPSCGKKSYGSRNIPKWLCPYCNTDLSAVPYTIDESAINDPQGEMPSPSSAALYQYNPSRS